MPFNRALFDLEIKVNGAAAIKRAADQLPKNARDEIRKGTQKLSREMANIVRRAGRADSRQSARAASTVRARTGAAPGVLAGPHPLLFGSEFGANGRYGWYAAERYSNSTGRQFRPLRRGASYWFFKTAEREQPRVDRAAAEIIENIARRWGA